MAVRRAVHVPWYATGFRADDLEAALRQISEISLRYGAHGWVVYRYDDDRYKFQQILEFDTLPEFQRFWYGEEFQDMRASCQSWYQVPLLYGWVDVAGQGALHLEPIAP
ncbi:MAG: hypothetical protein H0U79_07270 [Solirubrobacterales bacterium]|nr:hypothetical protein [Solirubrobacterales bacterium]